MSFTNSVFEVPGSPVEVLSGSQHNLSMPISAFLDSGTINSASVTIYGGPLGSPDIWTNVTSNILVGSVGTTATTITLTASGFTAGWGYRVVGSWHSSASPGYEVLEAFLILVCRY